MSDAYQRVTVGRYSDGRNMVINKRTQAMVDMVEYRLGFNLTMVQGSYNTATSASAGTHDGGGVIDMRTWDLTETRRNQALAVARQVGFYAWYRTAAQGFDPHMHWVAKGDAQLSPAAKQQAKDAEAGYNGLASHLKDNLNLNVPTFDYEEWSRVLEDLVNRIEVLEARVTATTNARAQTAYSYVVDGGAIDQRLDIVEARVGPNTDARAQTAYEAVTASGWVPTAVTDLKETDAALAAELDALKTQVAAIPKA